MRRRPWRVIRFHPVRKGRGERSQLLMSILAGLVLALLLIHGFDTLIHPQLIAITETKILNRLTSISNQAVVDAFVSQGISYGDLIRFHTGQAGDITALSADTVQLNELRVQVLNSVVGQVEDLDSNSLGIPFGVLTGVDFLSALGPRLPVQVLSVASAEGSYRNEFLAAGINQTLHRILLDVTVTARLLFPGGVETVTLVVPVCVAETVIVGQVPQTYLNLNQ